MNMHAILALVSVIVLSTAVHCTPPTQPKNGLIRLSNPTENGLLKRQENAPKLPADSCRQFVLVRPMTYGDDDTVVANINEDLFIAKLYGDDVKDYCHTISTAFELGCNKRKVLDLIAGPSGMVGDVCVVEWRLRINSFNPVGWDSDCVRAVMKRCYGREGGMPKCVCSCVSSHCHCHRASAVLVKRDLTNLSLIGAWRSIRYD